MLLERASARARRGDPPPDPAAGPGAAGAVLRPRRPRSRASPARGLEAAIERPADVVKTTIMRHTLHLAPPPRTTGLRAAARQARMRSLRKQYAHLDLDAVTAELRAWMRRAADQRRDPGARLAARGRDRRRLDVRSSSPARCCRSIQLPPAGHWNDTRRASFVVDPRPLPSPADAAALVLERYLAAFGPASRRDVAAWSGVAQRDFAEAFERLRDRLLPRRAGQELFDLPGQPLRPPRRRCRSGCSATGTSRCSPTPTASGSCRRRCRR